MFEYFNCKAFEHNQEKTSILSQLLRDREQGVAGC